MVSKALIVVGIVVLAIIVYFLLPKDLFCPTSPNLKFSQKECVNDPAKWCPEESVRYYACWEQNGTPEICRDAQQIFENCTRKFMTTNILDYSWVDSNTLRINAIGSVNCGASIICPSYQISGSLITLKFKESNNIPFIVAACECPHNITYEISGLEQKEYQISIKKE